MKMVTVVETRKTYTIRDVCVKLGLSEEEFGELVFASVPAVQPSVSKPIDKQMVFKFKKVVD